MSIFPTQYSTLSTAALQEYLRKAYNLQLFTCRLLMRNVSDTYLLERGPYRYIFKIYRDNHRKREEILAEAELLEALKANDCPVAAPVKDTQGNTLQTFNAAEGTRYGMLFEYAQGTVVHNLTPSQLQTIGREMANIHNVTSRLQLSHERRAYNNNTTLSGPLQTIAPYFKELPEEYAWLQHTARTAINRLYAFNTTLFSYGYCHYDFLPKNFHINEFDEVTFFDFDFAGKGFLINDVMTVLVHFFLHMHMSQITAEQASKDFNTFLSAYHAVRPVTNEELQAIPYLGVAFWLFYLEFACLHFEDWSSTFLNNRYLKDRVVLIKKWTAAYGQW
jgi:Ser/Thr protein kinase RdoA (MazF antagonist)